MGLNRASGRSESGSGWAGDARVGGRERAGLSVVLKAHHGVDEGLLGHVGRQRVSSTADLGNRLRRSTIRACDRSRGAEPRQTAPPQVAVGPRCRRRPPGLAGAGGRAVDQSRQAGVAAPGRSAAGEGRRRHPGRQPTVAGCLRVHRLGHREAHPAAAVPGRRADDPRDGDAAGTGLLGLPGRLQHPSLADVAVLPPFGRPVGGRWADLAAVVPRSPQCHQPEHVHLRAGDHGPAGQRDGGPAVARAVHRNQFCGQGADRRARARTGSSASTRCRSEAHRSPRRISCASARTRARNRARSAPRSGSARARGSRCACSRTSGSGARRPSAPPPTRRPGSSP